MTKLRLDSWKSIAKYLDRGQRTVQRWHAENGLPIHHFGGPQGCVFAYPEEIDAWLEGFTGQQAQQNAPQIPTPDAKAEKARKLAALASEMYASRSEKNLSSIAALYREALDEDPYNAVALVGTANVMISSVLLELMDSSVAYPCALEALRRTPQLDTQHPDAKCAAAFLKMAVERKWRQARMGFDEVLDDQPQNPLALAGRAFLHVSDAELGDAFLWAWEAWQQSPLVDSVRILLCWIKFLAADSEEALELVGQFKASGSSGPTIAAIQALALSQSAPRELNVRQIESIAAEFPQSNTLQGILGYAYGISGQTQKASQVLGAMQEMCERKKRNYSYALALVLMGLGRRQEVIPCLETSFEQGSIWSLGFRSDPILKPLRGDAQFEALLRKLGSKPQTQAIDQAKFLPKKLSFPAPTVASGSWMGSLDDSSDDLEDCKESGAA